MTETQTHTAEAGDETTLREAMPFALQRAFDFLEGLTENGAAGERKPLNPILIGGGAMLATAAFREALSASPAPRAPAVPEGLRRLSEAAEAAKQASEDYAENNPGSTSEGFRLRMRVCDTRNAFRDAAVNWVSTLAAAPAAPPADGGTEDVLGYATRLAQSLSDKHFPNPEWRPLPDLYGVLTQIDNMTTGLSRTPAGAAGDLVGEDRASILNLLERFRDFVIERAVVWNTDRGPCNHHNPIWAEIAEALSAAPAAPPADGGTEGACPICGRSDKPACAPGAEADECGRRMMFDQFGVTSTPDTSAVAQSDLAELLTILGMGDHARPQSSHEVFQEALGVLRKRLEQSLTVTGLVAETIAAGPISHEVAPPWECSIRAVCDPDGKRWRLVGENFEMQPVGTICVAEAKSLCQQIASYFPKALSTPEDKL